MVYRTEKNGGSFHGYVSHNQMVTYFQTTIFLFFYYQHCQSFVLACSCGVLVLPFGINGGFGWFWWEIELNENCRLPCFTTEGLNICCETWLGSPQTSWIKWLMTPWVREVGGWSLWWGPSYPGQSNTLDACDDVHFTMSRSGFGVSKNRWNDNDYHKAPNWL